MRKSTISARNKFLKSWVAQANSTLERSAPSDRGRGGQLEFAPVPLVPFADMDYWYLTEPLTWQVTEGSRETIVVPRGFATDFASVPRYLWTWLPPIGRYGYPAVVHDWLYWDQSIPRAEADLVFNAGLADLRIPAWKRVAMYRAVSWLGQKYWDENAALKKVGVGRVLKSFPPDAGVTWAEWSRKVPSVF